MSKCADKMILILGQIFVYNMDVVFDHFRICY